MPAHPRPLLLLAALALAACAGSRPAPAFRHTVDGPAHPWTHAGFDTSAGGFTFAVVSDLNGGERPGVFAQAVRQLRLLRPELVMSVGDLIDGPTTVDSTLRREWDEFDARAGAMPAPFFRVGGNHDLTGRELRAVWQSRYGPTYYAFVYKQVLFLVLDTEDLPPERARALFEARSAAIRAADAGIPGDTFAYYRMPERVTGGIGPEQAAYVVREIERHADVRWTFLFFHKPVWRNEQDAGFAAIESALAGRPYTVFSGHLHALAHTQRLGRDYFTLGTTGGSQDPRNPMSLDHLTLVRMTQDGPAIAHLRMDGILGGDGKAP